MPAIDVRDWTAARAWASNLAAQLQPALPHYKELKKGFENRRVNKVFD